MIRKSRFALQLTFLIAYLILIAVLFPINFAQDHGIVWLQAISTCVILIAGPVALYAAVQLKNCREPDTPLLKKLRWASALAFLVIWVGGLGVFAALSNTRRGWEIWVITSLPLVAFYFWNTRYPKV